MNYNRENNREKAGGMAGAGLSDTREYAIEISGATYFYRAYDQGEDGVYPELPAVSDVSLTVRQGEFVALAGHNGSGKSTLARLMNGIYRPASGEVKVLGLSTSQPENLFEIRKNLGLVFQNPDNQMVATIVEDDVAFGPENVGVPHEEIGPRISFALAAVGMEQYRESAAHRLSGGQKQRVAIAGVLALSPRIIVLDESTAMLDPKGRREVMQVIKKLNREQGITVLLITHFMEEAAQADRVVVLSGGKIAADGTPAEVFSRADVVESAGLTLPVTLEISRLLKERGIDTGGKLLTEDGLAEAIWRQYK